MLTFKEFILVIPVDIMRSGMGSKENNVDTLKTVKAFRYADDLMLLERIKKIKNYLKLLKVYF